MDDANPVFTFHTGSLPLLISIPHAGIEVPADIQRRFTAAGRDLSDTDWYVDQLYEFSKEMGASIIKANFSRYVVDLNRSPDSQSLYDSNTISPVCPLLTFAGDAIYIDGAQPDPNEIQRRIDAYWQPYHRRLADELERIKNKHGRALLWDAHSVASQVPTLFDGLLPAFNFGTRDHASCPEHVARSLVRLVETDDVFTAALNARFKGGYITLRYGRPANDIYAVQLELAQRTYMNEAPRGQWERERASAAVLRIERLLQNFVQMAAVAT